MWARQRTAKSSEAVPWEVPNDIQGYTHVKMTALQLVRAGGQVVAHPRNRFTWS